MTKGSSDIKILFAELNALRKASAHEQATIVGNVHRSGFENKNGNSARFDRISSFAQLNSSSIVAVDHRNHCLRMINRYNGKTTTYLGKCRSTSFKQVTGEIVSFENPYSILLDRSSNNLIVTVLRANMVYLIDNENKSVNKLTSIIQPIGITPDNAWKNLYFTTVNVIMKYNIDADSTIRITLVDKRGYENGDLSSAMFDMPRELLLIDEGLLLVADQYNSRIRVLEFGNGVDRVWPVCTGKDFNFPGPINKCGLRAPSSLLLVNDTLYIGSRGSISSVEGRRSIHAFASVGSVFLPHLTQ